MEEEYDDILRNTIDSIERMGWLNEAVGMSLAITTHQDPEESAVQLTHNCASCGGSCSDIKDQGYPICTTCRKNGGVCGVFCIFLEH